MNKKILISGIAILFICVGLSGCFESSKVSNDEIKTKNDDASELDLMALNWLLDKGWNYYNDDPKVVSWQIMGSVTNTHSKMADYVQITGEWYDENNILLEHKTITIENIRSGQTVEFGATNELMPETDYILNYDLFGQSDYTRDTFPQNVHAKCYVNYVDFYES